MALRQTGATKRQPTTVPAPASALRQINAANAQGGPDNITVITARFDGDWLREPDGAEGVGYQSYQLPPAGSQSDPSAGQARDSATSESILNFERLRNLGLIVLVLGVLVLLLAVWA